MFFPFLIFFQESPKRRVAQSFSVISVITGSETFVRKPRYQMGRMGVSLTTGSRPFRDS